MEHPYPASVNHCEFPSKNVRIKKRGSLYNLTFSELEQWLATDEIPRVHARPLWRALYQALEPDLTREIDFPAPLQRWLNHNLNTTVTLDTLTVTNNVKSADGYTQKLLLRLGDGQEIETVIMGYPGRFTACVSTQVGCALGCVFCATGQMGFVRNLRAGEIVAQVIEAQRQLRSQGPYNLRNVVLMGMGEPLTNYEAAIQAMAIVADPKGTNIGPGRITISTVGVVPGILRLANENQPYNLAVSLHAATDWERSVLVPVNRRWRLDELIEACRFYISKTGRRILFGWTLIEGRNDGPEQAQRLVRLLDGIDAHVNLISLNPTEEFIGHASAPHTAIAFKKILQTAGIPSTIRQRRGIDVAAGCGQLRSNQSVGA